VKRSRLSIPALDRLVASSVIALPRRTRGLSTPPAPLRAAGNAARVLARHTRLRAAAVVLVLILPLAFGGWRWLRWSSLVAVEHVQVSGVHGPDARAIEQALMAAGRRMTTLDVKRGALLAAVAPFHLVRSIAVSTSFPHGLRIRVVEQLPVATLAAQGTQTAVAANGAVLGPALVSASLPTIAGGFAPPTGAQVHDGSLRASLAILGAVPAPLAPFLARTFNGPRGITVVMRNGLQVYFGDASRAHAKWLALALVLGDSSSAHASAVDVRTPERPAAVLAEGAAPASAGAGETGPSAAAISSASIAASLAASAGFGSSAEAQTASAAKAAEASSPIHSEANGASGTEAGTAAPAQGASSGPVQGG
jgi:cell division septal protein FtsQ